MSHRRDVYNASARVFAEHWANLRLLRAQAVVEAALSGDESIKTTHLTLYVARTNGATLKALAAISGRSRGHMRNALLAVEEAREDGAVDDWISDVERAA